MIFLIAFPGLYFILSSNQKESPQIISKAEEESSILTHDEVVEDSTNLVTATISEDKLKSSSSEEKVQKGKADVNVKREKGTSLEETSSQKEVSMGKALASIDKPSTEKEEKKAKEMFKGAVRVVGINDEPLAGVVVESRNMAGDVVLSRSITDENGMADLGRDENHDILVVALPKGGPPFGRGHIKAHKYGGGEVLELEMPEKIHTIRGKVVDENDQPLTGVMLKGDIRLPSGSCTHHAEDLLRGKSDSSGMFELGPCSGEIRIKAQLEGWVQDENIDFDPEKETSLKVIMQRSWTRRVVVQGPDGQKIDQVDVSARKSEDEIEYFHNGMELASLKKVSGGVAEFSMPKEGYHHFKAKGDGFLKKEMVNVEASEAEVVITLERAHFIEGLVLDAQGNPIKGADVYYQYEKNEGHTTSSKATTDAKGHYVIKNIPPSVGTLKAKHQDFLPNEKVEELNLQEARELKQDFVLKKGLNVELTILGETTNEAIVSTEVSVYSKGEHQPRYKGKTNSEGLLNIPACEGPDEELQLEAKGYLKKDIVIESLVGQRVKLVPEVDFQIVLELPEGEKLPHSITLQKENDQRNWKHWNASKTKANFYKVSGIKPQRLSFRVQAHGFKKSEIQNIEILPLNNPLLSVRLLKAESIFVKVMKDNGEPYEGHIQWKLKATGDNGRTHSSSLSKAKGGQYKITVSEMDEYQEFMVQPKGYLPSPWYSIRNGSTFKSIEGGDFLHEIPLPDKGNTLKGVIVNEAGEGVSGVSLEAIQGAKKDHRSRAKSRSGGLFEISGLNREPLKLELYHKNYQMKRLSLDETALDVEQEIELGNGYQLQAGMKDTLGEPVSGIEISINHKRVDYSDYYHDRHVRSKKTSSNGQVNWEHLSPGRYSLSLANQDEGLVEELEVEVGPGVGDQVHWLEMGKGVSLKGKVVDDSGKGIPELHLNLSMMKMGSSFHRSTQTEADGSFVFNNLPDAQFQMGFYGSVWKLPGGQNHLMVKPSSEPLLLKLEPAPMIRGRVVDLEGKAVEGFSILIQHPSFGNMKRRLYNMKGLGDGRFESPSPTEFGQRVLIQATHPDWSPSDQIEHNFDSPSSEELTLVLKSGTELVVNLLGEAGEPISNAQLWFISPPNDQMFGFGGDQGVQKTSDTDGRATFLNLPEGEFDLKVKAPGYAPLSRREKSLPGSGLLSLQLERGATLKGRVLTAAGDPKAGVIVSAWVIDGSQNTKSQEVTSGGDGSYEMVSLSKGRYGLQVELGEERGAQFYFSVYDEASMLTKVDLDNNEIKSLDLQLPSEEGQGSIEGVMEGLEEGTSVMGLQLFRSEATNSFMPYKMTNADGEAFTFKSLDPGSYRVVAMANALKLEASVEVKAGEVTRVVLRPESGRFKAVLVGKDGPISDQIQVALFPAGAFKGGGNFAEQMTKGHNAAPMMGAVDIQGLKPGNYEMMVMDLMLGKYAPHIVRGIKIDGGTTDIGEVAVPLSEKLSFTIQDSLGSPVQGAGVGFYIQGGEYLPSISMTSLSDSDGKITVSVPPDANRMVIGAPDKAPLEIGLPSPGQVVSFLEGGRLDVQILGEDVDGWKVSLLKGNGEGLPFVFHQGAMMPNFKIGSISDSEGRATIANIPSGEFMVSISKGGKESVSSEKVYVENGQRGSVEIQAGSSKE